MITIFEKAKQVRVREILEDSKPYEFDAILFRNKLIAMDNGAILDSNTDWIEIIKEYPWFPVSLGE